MKFKHEYSCGMAGRCSTCDALVGMEGRWSVAGKRRGRFMVGGWADVVAWGILLSILFSMLNVTTAWWAVSGILINHTKTIHWILHTQIDGTHLHKLHLFVCVWCVCDVCLCVVCVCVSDSLVVSLTTSLSDSLFPLPSLSQGKSPSTKEGQVAHGTDMHADEAETYLSR